MYIYIFLYRRTQSLLHFRHSFEILDTRDMCYDSIPGSHGSMGSRKNRGSCLVLVPITFLISMMLTGFHLYSNVLDYESFKDTGMVRSLSMRLSEFMFRILLSVPKGKQSSRTELDFLLQSVTAHNAAPQATSPAICRRDKESADLS